MVVGILLCQMLHWRKSLKVELIFFKDVKMLVVYLI